MPQHGPDVLKRYAVSQHCGGSRMPQHMSTTTWRLDTGAMDRCGSDTRNRATAGKRTDWCLVANKKRCHLCRRSSGLKIGEHSIANFLSQRHLSSPPPFTGNPDAGLVPIEVFEAQVADIGCAES